MTAAIRIALACGFAVLLGALQVGQPGGDNQNIPESVRRNLPPGATIRLMGPGVSDGLVVYEEPRLLPQRNEAAIALSLDAVVAEQRAVVAEARLVTLGLIAVPAPFSIRYEPGSYFAVVLADDGPALCLVGIPRVLFEPAHDEHGEIFPGACLIDRDGDGRFEFVRMMPYNARAGAPRQMPIAPVALRPAAADDPDPRAARLSAMRRIRVSAIGERDATLVLEHGIQSRGRGGPRFSPTDAEDQVLLELRPGARAELGGIALILEGGPGTWRVRATGAFPAWISLDADRVRLRIDRHQLGPRRL